MLSQEFLLKGVAAPLLAGFATTLIASRFSPRGRGIAAIGAGIAQVVGTALLVWGQPDWLPSRNLHWIPWATLGAAAVGPALAATGIVQIERWLLAGLMSLATAALIVPTWPDLWPTRTISIVAVTAALTVLARSLDGVIRRVPAGLVATSLGMTAVTSALLIAACLSLSMGETALVAAASLAGPIAALLIRPNEQAVRGLALPYAVSIGGWCYVSTIELPPPAPPLVGLLFLPLAPLMLWAVASGPLSRRSLGIRRACGILLVLGYLAAVGAWTWNGNSSAGDEYDLTTIE